MYYVARGSIPRQRHTQHRAPDGSLYAEELFGVEGFTGRSSLLYHLMPPTRTHKIEAVGRIELEAADDGLHRHRLTKTGGGRAEGRRRQRPHPALLQQRRRLRDRPAGRGDAATASSTATAIADEMLFVHEGTGVCDTIFGPLRYGPGDYLVLPIGTTWRLDPDPGIEQRILYLEAPSEIEPPKRYRNDYGQLLEHAPYIAARPPRPGAAASRAPTQGEFVIHVRSTDRITAYHYRHHPFDVVGWDGYLWPFRFDIADFQPITGRVHQPPPVHQTFQARNFVVCSFVPRKFDYHPLAIPAPYNHSEHQQRRGHLLRRRQLHEPARAWRSPRSRSTRRGSRTGRIRARSRHRSARRRPRSWRSWSTRSIRSRSRRRRWTSTTTATRTAGCRRRTTRGEASELAERGPEAFPD